MQINRFSRAETEECYLLKKDSLAARRMQLCIGPSAGGVGEKYPIFHLWLNDRPWAVGNEIKKKEKRENTEMELN